MWLKLFPDYHPHLADGDSSLGGILPTAFGGWKLFPSVYFLRNFSLMKYRLNGRIFTPGRSGENDFDKKLCYFKYAVIFQLSVHLLFSISCLCLTQQGRYLTILFRIQLCSYLKLFYVWSLWFFLRLN